MNSEMNCKTMLCVGAHIDDCQCGSVSGLSRKLANAGWRVVYLNAYAKKAMGDAETLRIIDQSAELVGAVNVNLDFPILLDAATDRKSIARIAGVLREFNPEIVCIPWGKDNHYEHTSAARAALKAISYMNIIGEDGCPLDGKDRIHANVTDILAYEISSWQTKQFEPDFFVDITREIDAAEASIRAFTQFSAECLDYYAREKRTRCASWGVRAGCAYAEAFRYLGPAFPLRSKLGMLLGEDLRPAGNLQYPWGAFEN